MKMLLSCACPLLVGALLSASAAAQAPVTLTDEDRAAIQGLVTGYARALASCNAEAYADLFAPGTGYFASGIRGQVVGRERLIALVQSERQCTAPAAATQAPRPGGGNGPTATIEPTSTGARGVADLGAAGMYQDEYVKTPSGWRFRARTVLIPAEKAGGLDAVEMAAIQRTAAAAAPLGDYYVPDQSGVKRLRTSGVAISVSNGVVTGKAYMKEGGYYDDVYEKIGPGQWRIKSRVKVPAEP
jgi:hypothetical protein